MPEGLVQVVTGRGSELGSPIIQHSDFLMFTGSTAVGRKVASEAGEHLIDYSMELGGKNALLVLDDADVDKAVRGAARASFSNTGQLCISIERIYVPDSMWDSFTSRFAAAAKNMTLSPDLDYSADMGSLVSRKQLTTVSDHVEDARNKGATVLAGGQARPDLGPLFYEPTILTDVTADMTVFDHETFGPVVSLYRVSSEEEAIRLANDNEYGLNFSVWTSDPAHGRRVAEQLEAGTVNVNDAYAPTWGSVDAPMGGMKASGVGRRHGEHGIGALINKRARVIGTNVRRRPLTGPGSKADITAEVVRNVWPLVEDGTVKPVISATRPLSEARTAHEMLDSADSVGKVLLLP